MHHDLSDKDAALVALGRALRRASYRFTTPTPATHARVNARPENKAATSLTDAFGWSRPFDPALLSAEIGRLAAAAGIVDGGRSTARFSTLDTLLFAHSAFPTSEPNAVFFGPDTYRFARVLKSALAHEPLPKSVRVVDIGCGSGAGGINLSHLLSRRCDVDLILGDINPLALRFARVNAQLNECSAMIVDSDVLGSIEGDADIIIANPPYLVDGAKRVYRHGGGAYGAELSVRIVRESLPRLRKGGSLVLYTGSAIVSGVDIFREEIASAFARTDFSYDYEEVDPDVFGEELCDGPYRYTDRIAAVALTARRRKK